MTPSRKLAIGALVVTVTTAYLAYVGAARNWQYYLTVDEAVADATSLSGRRIRVSGRVATGTLTISEDRRQAEFDLAGARHKLHVSCQCIMPDNLADDIDVVVEGVFRLDGLLGHKVITKCASKYLSQEALAAKPESEGDLERR